MGISDGIREYENKKKKKRKETETGDLLIGNAKRKDRKAMKNMACMMTMATKSPK